MANVGRQGIVRYEETFAADNIGTGIAGVDGGTADAVGIAWIQAMDTGDTPFGRAVSASKGLHLAGSMAATDDNLVELTSNQTMFYGSVGQQAVELMIQFDNVGTFAMCFGLNDDLTGSARLPVEISTTTISSTVASFVGIVKDFDATNDELHAFWTDDGVDSTEPIDKLRMKGMSLTADKWLWLRVETQDRGSGTGVRATFHAVQGSKHVTKEFDTTLDNDQAMGWYLGVANRGATARGIYMKLPAWEQSIAD
ncbi:hypothetical protein LCGC14_0349780 [marine sediment metagenome]|uniref:Uncharacterized protein n=1 Tax=marine sediment metagenome TaxID=412755 RepID=A0A0F9VYF5_9ZZZZ